MSKPQLLLRPPADLLDRIERAAKARRVTRQELVYAILADALPAGVKTAKAWRELTIPGFPADLVPTVAPDAPDTPPESPRRRARKPAAQ